MGGGTTQVSICNAALNTVGASNRITAIDEDSEEARACNAVYDDLLDDLLEEHPWSFAQKRLAFSTLAEDPVWGDDTISVVYQKPNDMIKLNFVNVENALVKMEGDQILSDTSNLKGLYTYRLTDPTKYSAKFITVFIARLAAELAYTLTNSRGNVADLYEIYERKMAKAIATDSQQGTALPPAQDEWLLARAGGSSDLLGRTSWETWYPISY